MFTRRRLIGSSNGADSATRYRRNLWSGVWPCVRCFAYMYFQARLEFLGHVSFVLFFFVRTFQCHRNLWVIRLLRSLSFFSFTYFQYLQNNVFGLALRAPILICCLGGPLNATEPNKTDPLRAFCGKSKKTACLRSVRTPVECDRNG